MVYTSSLATTVVVFLLTCSRGSTNTVCEDIDPVACRSMAQQNANICADPILSKTACPKFCNNCPLTCFSCNLTSSKGICNAVACAAGETCLTARESSGAQQFTLRCAEKSMCGTTSAIKCCSQPLCNDPHILITRPTPTATTPTTTTPTTTSTTPTTPTTTTAKTTATTTTRKPTTTSKPACYKDIIFVVDESSAMSSHWTHMKSFVNDLIDRMPIGGSHGAKLSFTTFTTTYKNRWHLNSYNDATHLKLAVSRLSAHGGQWADNLIGLHYLNNYALSSSHGNRHSASNVAVVISEGHSHYMNPFIASQAEYTEMSSLHKHFHNVIAIGIGSSVDSNQISHMATGSSHKFLIRSGSYLKGIENKVYSLICG
ncbi:uncharacterized protein LOC123538967 [Mercenaria mercenaria]|uniref:uncharacterized protein LOC123538967 n=1 Tax=Mercenaria mercenaria TaxID=6596 RepID=UPI00234F4518|nr:uncharacterized protein LOC123538967 [Mercenaria mercenaria]